MSDFIISNHTGGRLANQLYYVLQAYVMSQRKNLTCKYMMSDTFCKATDILKYAKALNIDRYVAQPGQHINFLQPLNTYYQQFGVDFTEDELNSFIDQTLLNSSEIQSKHKNDADNMKSVALHVRNGDYLNIKKYLCFDRIQYIKSAICHIPDIVDTVEVYSDDINATMMQFDNILKDRFMNVYYHPSDPELPLADFCEMSTYRNKIMWNSTFSWWTGFIANRMFSDGIFICPSTFFSGQSTYSHTPAKWIHI